MELAAAPPPDSLSVTAPQSRGPPSAVRPPGARDGDASPTVAPFDLLLQMLGSALPAGQTLPTGGSGLPGVDASACSGAPAAPAASAATAPATLPRAGAPAQPAPTDLADLLRLALARAAAAPTPTPAPADASTPTDAASCATTTAPAAALPPAQAQASSAAAPIDLAALLGGAESAQAPAAPVAVLDNASRTRAATDAPRRAAASVTSPADRAAELANELASADTSLQRAADTQGPVVAPVAQAVATKGTSLDDALPLAVTPTAGADASAAPALPLAHAPAPAHAPSAAPAQSATPQGFGDAVDTTSTRWHETLANRIQWLVDHDVGEAKIKLNPPELGALDVKISLADDKTFVQMTAHSASARDELSQGLPRLRELLSAGGLELGGATVSGGHDERGAFGSGVPQPVSRVAAFASGAAEASPDAPRPRLGSSAAVIDTFA